MFPFRSRSLFHLAELMAYDMERQFARQWRRPFEHFERQALMERPRYRDPFEQLESEMDQALMERPRYRDPFEEFNQAIETSFKDMEKNMENQNQELPKVGNDVYYKMIMRTNDNGHVKVKTMEKEPGAEWKVKMEEFKVDKAVEGKEAKGPEKIENKPQETQKKVAEPSKEKPKEISESA